MLWQLGRMPQLGFIALLLVSEADGAREALRKEKEKWGARNGLAVWSSKWAGLAGCAGSKSKSKSKAMR